MPVAKNRLSTTTVTILVGVQNLDQQYSMLDVLKHQIIPGLSFMLVSTSIPQNKAISELLAFRLFPNTSTEISIVRLQQHQLKCTLTFHLFNVTESPTFL